MNNIKIKKLSLLVQLQNYEKKDWEWGSVSYVKANSHSCTLIRAVAAIYLGMCGVHNL